MTIAHFKVEHKEQGIFFSNFLSDLWYGTLDLSQSWSKVCTALENCDFCSGVFTHFGCHVHDKLLVRRDGWNKWVSECERKSNIYQMHLLRRNSKRSVYGNAHVLAAIACRWGNLETVVAIRVCGIIIVILLVFETAWNYRSQRGCIFKTILLCPLQKRFKLVQNKRHRANKT